MLVLGIECVESWTGRTMKSKEEKERTVTTTNQQSALGCSIGKTTTTEPLNNARNKTVKKKANCERAYRVQCSMTPAEGVAAWWLQAQEEEEEEERECVRGNSVL